MWASYVSNHRRSPLYGCKEVSQRRVIWTKPLIPHLTSLIAPNSTKHRRLHQVSNNWICIVIRPANATPIANGGLCQTLWNKFTTWTLQSASLEHVFKEMSIKIHRQFKVNLLSFPLLCQSKPFHANPLLQRQSCWIGSRAARNMSPCIHLALLPIKWKSANRTTIGQSKANWTQTWGQSKGISASKERTKDDCQTLHLGI